jgi:hypothetical protein
MGETFAETRVEVEAQRRHLADTGERLKARVRRSLDLKAKLRENPLLYGGLIAGAVFLAVGGPMRVARLARRRMRPTTAERAYDLLPDAMQSWVDALTERLGSRADEAREGLAQELVRWRHDPGKDKKLSKALAERLVEGPPGPSRTAWKAFEAGAAIITAALARKAVERFLSGEPRVGRPTPDAAGSAAGAAKADPRHAKRDVTPPATERRAAAIADRRTP